jgi:hypothetical protein
VTETVTVTPQVKYDTDGNPVPGSADPVELTPLEVAPGNTLLSFGIGGELDDVEFTVYLPLRVRTGMDGTAALYQDTTDLVADDCAINVRGRDCRARIQLWKSQRSATKGGLAVLCRSATGKAA